MERKIIIVGAGPTGLGAAWRLNQLGYKNWLVYEKNGYVGGLSASFLDPNGFWWDVGGHIQFSHYMLFDKIMDQLLNSEWLYHERNSNIWLMRQFVPYPFQYNIRYLPKNIIKECITGIEYNKYKKEIYNFRDWIMASFGEGIAKYFMLPYNRKVWAIPLEKLGYYWIGERVAIPDIARIKRNISEKLDDVSWGPNNKFHFPNRGGTGEIWRRLAKSLPSEQIILNKPIESIMTKKRKLMFKDKTWDQYDILINTMPLDLFIKNSDLTGLDASARELRHNSVNVIGLGLKGTPPAHLKRKCWMYFPESQYSFYRMTVFSNYSPNNVPDIKKYWSLMAEVSETTENPLKDKRILARDMIKALTKSNFIKSDNDIVSVFTLREEYGYPLPTIHRDRALNKIISKLAFSNIYSRGRFGLWKYEVGNQDHSLMQGVECVDNILLGKKEMTAWKPEMVNARK